MASGIASGKHYKVTTTVPCLCSCIDDDNAPEYHKVPVYDGHTKLDYMVTVPRSCIDDKAPEYHKVHVYGGYAELDDMVTVPCPCIECINPESLKAHVHVGCVDFWSKIGKPGMSGSHDEDFICPICGEDGPDLYHPQIISCGHIVCSEHCWKEYVNRFVPLAPPIVTNECHQRDVLLVPDCTRCADLLVLIDEEMSTLGTTGADGLVDTLGTTGADDLVDTFGTTGLMSW